LGFFAISNITGFTPAVSGMVLVSAIIVKQSFLLIKNTWSALTRPCRNAIYWVTMIRLAQTNLSLMPSKIGAETVSGWTSGRVWLQINRVLCRRPGQLLQFLLIQVTIQVWQKVCTLTGLEDFVTRWSRKFDGLSIKNPMRLWTGKSSTPLNLMIIASKKSMTQDLRLCALGFAIVC
jgi:hypothetical protein